MDIGRELKTDLSLLDVGCSNFCPSDDEDLFDEVKRALTFAMSCLKEARSSDCLEM